MKAFVTLEHPRTQGPLGTTGPHNSLLETWDAEEM